MNEGKSARKCLNCGRHTGPAFCPHCGQEAEIRRGPLLDVGREILSDWLSLDSRLLRSLGALLRPGLLSELYVAGKRAPFLRPLRLYLLASVVLFSTALTIRVPAEGEINLWIGGELIGIENDAKVRRELDFLSDQWTRNLAGARLDRLRVLPAQEILELVFDGLRRILPTTLILFVPFLGLGLKLLYLRGRAKHTQYLDHLAFALHFQSAVFLAIAFAWLAAQPLGAGATVAVYVTICLAIILVYLPLALRRFYGQSWLWTAAKAFAVLFVYFNLLGLAINLAVLVGIRGV